MALVSLSGQGLRVCFAPPPFPSWISPSVTHALWWAYTPCFAHPICHAHVLSNEICMYVFLKTRCAASRCLSLTDSLMYVAPPCRSNHAALLWWSEGSCRQMECLSIQSTPARMISWRTRGLASRSSCSGGRSKAPRCHCHHQRVSQRCGRPTSRPL